MEKLQSVGKHIFLYVSFNVELTLKTFANESDGTSLKTRLWLHRQVNLHSLGGHHSAATFTMNN